MDLLTRYKKNPILGPDRDQNWDKEGAFNGCPVFYKGAVHMVYRAVSEEKDQAGVRMKVSTIGHVTSNDGLNFKNRKQLLVPEHDWEKYGLEDPRVTKFGNQYYIFYTALSGYPFGVDNIKIGVAMTKDFKKFVKKPVTTFNSKAMALFPEPIKGKMTAILTVNTDNPPAKISIAQFDRPEDMWSKDFWDKWYEKRGEHAIPLQRSPYDHIEVGAPPIKTKKGWLVIYSYIRNYFDPPATFGVEAALLDLKHPRRIIARSIRPLLIPEMEYERNGQVSNIAFPSGAFVKHDQVYFYYGAADTSCCVAVGYLDDILDGMMPVEKFQRFKKNPVLSPSKDVSWRSKAVFNPAAVKIKNTTHILYRAMSEDNTSVMGYAESKDGFNLSHVCSEPAYVPRTHMEQKLVPGGNSGCEDPRLTVIGKNVYMLYTAFNGKDFPHVAMTSISVNNFLNRKWNWSEPVIISPAGLDDKDAAIFPQKIKGKYVFLHRLSKAIWIDYKTSLAQLEQDRLGGDMLMGPRQDYWDNDKIGLSCPPILTSEGWLLLYHGICKRDMQYRVGAVLLKKDDPSIVIARSDEPILEPEMNYETEGIVKNVVFPCGATVRGSKLFLYYGGADTVMGVATLDLNRLLTSLKKTHHS
jgi:predicted GH43/DUF377 family glycosyl hydrolase